MKRGKLYWRFFLGAIVLIIYLFIQILLLPMHQNQILSLGRFSVSSLVLIQLVSTWVFFSGLVWIVTIHSKNIIYYFVFTGLASLGYAIYFFLIQYFHIIIEGMPENFSTAIFHFMINPFLLVVFLIGWGLKSNATN